MPVDHVVDEALGELIEAAGDDVQPEGDAVDIAAQESFENVEATGSAGYLDLIETYDRPDSAVIFGGEGRSFAQMRESTNKRKLAKFATLYREMLRGRVSPGQVLRASGGDSYLASQMMRENMMSSEFSTLLGSTLDRLLIAKYETYNRAYTQYARIRQVRDFRNVSTVRRSGGTGLSAVREGATYERGSVSEAAYTYNVGKYGKIYPFTWEMMVNDDLDAFETLPDDMRDDAVQEEMYYAATLFVENSTLYASNHDGGDGSTYSNTGTAALAKASLQAAMEAMVKFPGDPHEDGTRTKPLFNSPQYLVIPPALETIATEIIGSPALNHSGGDSTTGISAVAFPSVNGLYGKLIVIINPYIPVVAASNAHTQWYLFSDPGNGRHAIEMGFLRGYLNPQVFKRAGNVVGSNMGEAFDDDSIAWKVRHVFGGSHANAAGGWRYTYRSTGAS